MKPQWKQITGFNRYEVSNTGQIRRRMALDRYNYFKGPTASKLKRTVILTVDGVPHGKQVSHLVGAAFSRDYDPLKVAAFRDGDPQNCAAKNLIWRSRSAVVKEHCFRGPRIKKNQKGQTTPTKDTEQ